MRNKYKIGILLMCSLLLLTGCWNNVELNQRHIVLDMAIDKAENGEYSITYSIPDVAKLSGDESLSEEVKSALTVQSKTIAESIHEVELKIQNTVSFSHMKAILLGESLMQDPTLFKMAIESLIENREIASQTYLLAVKGEAATICKAESYQNPVVGLYVMKYFNNGERTIGDNDVQSLGRFNKEMQETAVSTLPIIESDEEEKTLKIEGAAVIKDYKLVDWLDKAGIRAKLFIEGQVKNMPLVIPVGEEFLTYKIVSETADVEYTEVQGKLGINIWIKTIGNLMDYQSDTIASVRDQEVLAQVRERINEKIAAQIEDGLKRAREVGADYLYLARDCYRKNPQLFEKYQSNWENYGLDQAIISINVQSVIQGEV